MGSPNFGMSALAQVFFGIFIFAYGRWIFVTAAAAACRCVKAKESEIKWKLKKLFLSSSAGFVLGGNKFSSLFSLHVDTAAGWVVGWWHRFRTVTRKSNHTHGERASERESSSSSVVVFNKNIKINLIFGNSSNNNTERQQKIPFSLSHNKNTWINSHRFIFNRNIHTHTHAHTARGAWMEIIM